MCLPIGLVVLKPEAVTMTDPHKLVEQNLGEEFSWTTRQIWEPVLISRWNSFSKTTGPDVTAINVVIVHITEVLNAVCNDRINTIQWVQVFKAVHTWKSISKTG